jgi:hypothetical protein
MSAQSEIKSLLKQWFELTQAEGAAIENAAWRTVAEIQARKDALQNSLNEARQKWVSENPGLSPNSAAANPFRAEIARLISLETRNADRLAAQRNKAHERQVALEQSFRNLRKIQRSYVHGPSPALLHSYS